MGGRAFPHLNLQRIARADISATIQHVVETLDYPGFDLDYAYAHLMGSAGKQDDSGDLDFAVNERTARFYGEPDLPVLDIRDMAVLCRLKLPGDRVDTKTISGGQFQSAWPIAGDESKGLVQVDFIAGDPMWLLFAHHSPGKDVSPWKGVMITTLFGVMAKMSDLHLTYYPDSKDVWARVSWNFDLEKGLCRRWAFKPKPDWNLKTTDPNTFETLVANAPRYARVGHITDPDAVLTIVYGVGTSHEEVNTFEKAVARARLYRPHYFPELKERFLDAFMRSAARHEYVYDEVANHSVWG